MNTSQDYIWVYLYPNTEYKYSTTDHMELRVFYFTIDCTKT